MKAKKIFCKNCDFLLMTSHKAYCTYSENTEKIDTWYDEKYIYLKEPQELNKNNDCKWYK